jgi:alpha-D-ribose 1-methylphosphonate 5-triphosphate diphosphatase
MKPTAPEKLAIQGVSVLTPHGWVDDATVLIEDGKFVSIGQDPRPSGYIALDMSGLQMLPGIVDLHGDAFERMICPRPGVNFPLEMALIENDQALLSAGITTFFYSMTDSFEPGLRSRQTVRQLIELISGPLKLRVNSRIHVRHEQANTEGHDELCSWIETGKIHLLSLNNHLPPTADKADLWRYTQGMRQRIKLTEEEVYSLIETARRREAEGLTQLEDLVQRAHQANIPVASHDDETEADVALSRQRKVAIAEFPASLVLAAQSRQYGAAVLMGAPNLVRGGSHVGYMGVAEAVKAGVVDCLCSDYHYPSLFHAPFKLAELGLLPLEDAWKLVSTYPAKAAGLEGRKGAIAPGLDADFLLLQPNLPQSQAITAVYIQGQQTAQFAPL